MGTKWNVGRPGPEPSIRDRTVRIEFMNGSPLVVEPSAPVAMPLGAGVGVRPVFVRRPSPIAELSVAMRTGEGSTGWLPDGDDTFPNAACQVHHPVIRRAEHRARTLRELMLLPAIGQDKVTAWSDDACYLVARRCAPGKFTGPGRLAASTGSCEL